jgi:dihydroorotate dehydrogenase
MGFNNDGVIALVDNVRGACFGQKNGGILGINIGKNAATSIESAADDYLACLEQVYGDASYVTVNISSPNTKNLRQLQGESELDALLAGIKVKQARLADQHGRYVPIALKIAPDLDDAQIVNISDALKRHSFDAVIATNTTLARHGVEDQANAAEGGGLSGAPLFARSTAVVATLATQLAGELPIIASGGILDGADARAKIDAGASLVQLYSGLIYRGPDLVRECVAATRS